MSKINVGRIHSEQEKKNRINAMMASKLYHAGRISFSNTMKTRHKEFGFSEKEIEGRKKTAQKLLGRTHTKEAKKNIADGNHSNVQWTITFGEQTYLITDNVNKWAKNFGVSHNVLFDALKRTNPIEVYKDKSNVISGSIKQGKFKGLLITRSPVNHSRHCQQ